MPLYQYIYLNHNKKRKKGFIYGNRIELVKKKLLDEKIPIISIKSEKKGSSKNHFNKASLLLFFEHLERLIASSIPLHDALLLIASQFQSSKVYHIIASISEMVESGHSLHFALKQFPKSFPPYIRAIIRSGEISGDLSKSLSELNQYLRWKNSLIKKVFGAVSYPMFLLCFGCLIFFVILLYVVPSIGDLFDQSPSSGISGIVFSLSTFVQDYHQSVALGGFVIVSIFTLYLSSNKRREQVSNYISSLPVIKDVTISFSLLSYFQVISTLFSSSIPLLDSLKIARQSIHLSLLRKDLMIIEKCVERGLSLSAAMKKAKCIPLIATQLVEIGEASGKLLQGINSIKKHFENKVQGKIELIQKYGQPLLLLIIGVVIGALMLSILIPLTDMSNISI